MANLPTDGPRIREALEACRPGSGDVSDPEMPEMAPLAAGMAGSPELRDLYERSQCLDAAIAEVFHDVSVPDGLEGRLLAGLTQEREEATPAGERELDVGAAPVAVPTAAPPERETLRSSRRRLMALVTSVAAVVLIAVGVFMLTRLGRGEGRPIELDQAIDRFEADLRVGEHATGEPIETAPADYPFSPWVVEYAGVSWRRVDNLFDRSGIAYDLSAPGGALATLYVVRCSASANLPPVPDVSKPSFATGNCSVMAWQETNLVYVLVVRGGEREHLQFIHRGVDSPLAWRSKPCWLAESLETS